MNITDPLQEEVIREAYQKLGSKRAVCRETGLSWRAVARIIPGGQAQSPQGSEGDGIDYDRLAALVAARLSQSGPVNEGPPAPQEWRQPKRSGIIDADRIYERILWMSDLHFPYHSQPAIDAALDLASDWKPTLIVLGGDQFDCHMISRYAKEPGRLRDTLQAEFDAFRPTQKRIESLGCKVVMLLGNHDARIDAVVGDNPGLDGLRCLGWHKMAELPESWEILPNQSRYRVGNLDFLHGDLKGRGGGAKHIGFWMLSKIKRSTIFGHFHKFNTFPEPDGDGIVRCGFAIGHMCDPVQAASYCPVNDWVQGFATIDMDRETGIYDLRNHMIHGGKFRFNGKSYGD